MVFGFFIFALVAAVGALTRYAIRKREECKIAWATAKHAMQQHARAEVWLERAREKLRQAQAQ